MSFSFSEEHCISNKKKNDVLKINDNVQIYNEGYFESFKLGTNMGSMEGEEVHINKAVHTETHKLYPKDNAIAFSLLKKNSYGRINNGWGHVTRKNWKINKKLQDFCIIKNVLNVYFLFDKDNNGYIEKKYACYVIQMIYENDVNFMVENIKLNEDETGGTNENLHEINRKEKEENDEAFFCTKSFANFLLIILREVSVFEHMDEFIKKEFFIDIVIQFIRTSRHSKGDNDIYGMMKYPQNMITKFYSYVHYLKKEDCEKKKKELEIKKKKKQLKSICILDEQLVNADLDTHVKYFNEKTRKKLESIKMEKNDKEMKECTFYPELTEKPLYLLNKKLEINKKKLNENKEINKKYNPLTITYDIDDSIERTLHLPEEVSLKNHNAHLAKFKDLQYLYHENNTQREIELKYIIHQGHVNPKKIYWRDTLRNRRAISIRELDMDL
ncbi:hypothetical protein, conserved [Plasmodium gonderi]|uniref:Uncharacterized protein n=1 Tax=Plasmodium gonderi TaxID=77519 RepID=A0A1Y1JNM2_PLAGO|nr:hypothetical protein, conserved [Plasmodium gonderi]GAW81993.1 hypothetical protein, conserved [Plasmodium gonderi]